MTDRVENDRLSHRAPQWYGPAVDLLVTLLLWTYFTAGFLVLFAPFYLISAVFARNRQRRFQYFNHMFYRGFFLLCRVLMPGQKWHIAEAVRQVRSSVVVCNHISYIDSILLISLFARHTTIVKNRLFQIPIFGWMLGLAGYLPASAEGRPASMLIERMDAMPSFLADGGNLFIFPEGTRSRTGTIGPLNTGAFKIARLCRAPVAVLSIRNSDRLFTPDKFRFNSCAANTIQLELLARLTPEYDSDRFSMAGLMNQVRALLEGRANAEANRTALEAF
jgi:1-acyl-sn-glycerol-3-phosphate acyltransferase